MTFLRLELHNHTTESDASITCAELLDYMAENKVDGFALTDHNTISGHRKMAAQPPSSASTAWNIPLTTAISCA